MAVADPDLQIRERPGRPDPGIREGGGALPLQGGKLLYILRGVTS